MADLIERLKMKLPWQAKIPAKIVISRLPLRRWLSQKFKIFQHGHMERPEYALDVFQKHFRQTGFDKRPAGFVVLELGPGDSLFTAPIACALGAGEVYLVDSDTFAPQDMEPYRVLERFLVEKGICEPDTEEVQSVSDLLRKYSAKYYTQGLDSLKTIPSESVDLLFSQAVLEHIRREDFLDVLRETRRVLKPGGVCSHRVDLQDHLGNALNNLRFSEWLWEKPFMVNSGFYTNRIRFSEMLDLVRCAGFAVSDVQVERWEHLPTPKKSMAYPFRELPLQELLVSGFDLVLRAACRLTV